MRDAYDLEYGPLKKEVDPKDPFPWAGDTTDGSKA
jgi:hypothetical protein